MHIVSLRTEIPSVFNPSPFQSYSYIICAFVFTLHIYRAGDAYQHFVGIESSGVALSGGHHAEWLIG